MIDAGLTGTQQQQQQVLAELSTPTAAVCAPMLCCVVLTLRLLFLALIRAGASPISSEVMMFLRVCFGCHVLEGYGMTGAKQ